MINEHIKQLRIKKGISQAKLAEIIGVSVLTIKNIENGKTDFKWSTGISILKVLLPKLENGKIDFSILSKLFE